MEEILKSCNLCPRHCNVNRLNNEIGYCRAGKNPRVALSSLHYFEEPCISGEEGSGTVFFEGCNLNCIFCQNYEISQSNQKLKEEITINELANIFLDLQSKKANNINLVTGFMYVPQIVEALKIAKEKGLKIPIVYNSSGYESVETLKLLDGFVDVYLPDLKYFDNALALKLSGINNYFDIASNAILEMYRQVGAPQFDDNGMITKGLIIRHLILPNYIDNSKKCLKWIHENIDKNVYVSVMAQYFPTNKAKNDKKLNRKITEEEYNEIQDLVFKYDFNGFIQDLGENEEQYVPKFKE